MDETKTYRGYRMQDRGVVEVITDNGSGQKEYRELPLYLEIENHSPSGFNWGYAGSGPSQLALALLYDVTGKAEVALIAHQGFKHDGIAKLPTEEDWQLTSIQIENWIEELKVKVDGWIKDTMDPTA